MIKSVLLKMKARYQQASSMETASLIYLACLFSVGIGALQSFDGYLTYFFVAIAYAGQGLYRIKHPNSIIAKTLGKFGLISVGLIGMGIYLSDVFFKAGDPTMLAIFAITMWLMIQKRLIQLLLVLPITKRSTPKFIKVCYQIVLFVVVYITGAFVMLPIALWMLSTEIDFSRKKHVGRNGRRLTFKERFLNGCREYVKAREEFKRGGRTRKFDDDTYSPSRSSMCGNIWND